jgi:hypothetical protein
MKASAALTLAIAEAIEKAVKAGLDQDEITAVLDAAKEMVENHGIED